MILRRMVDDKIKTVHDKFDFYALEEEMKRWTSKAIEKAYDDIMTKINKN